jgi:hypothetical protein
MVNHEYKFVYIHPPKNAGTSIEQLFNFPRTIQPHDVADTYKKKYPDYYYWITIRNSWDRLVSMYYYNEGISNRLTFKEFCMEIVHPNGKSSIPNSPGWSHYLGAHGQLYYCYYYDNNLYCIDFYVNTWSMKEQLPILFNKLNINKNILDNIPYINTTKHKDYREEYDEESKEACYLRYQREIDHFGFDFDDPKKTKPFVGIDLSGIKV